MGTEVLGIGTVGLGTGQFEHAIGNVETVQFHIQEHSVETSRKISSEYLDADYPMNAIDEWPQPKKIHTFYFIKCRPHDDPNLKEKIAMADEEIQKRTQTKLELTEILKDKMADKAEIIAQLKALDVVENKQFHMMMEEKKKAMEPLQQGLGVLQRPNGFPRETSVCSSEEEINEVIQDWQYTIQHEYISFNEDKQMFNHFKHLEGTQGKFVPNAAARMADFEDLMCRKETNRYQFVEAEWYGGRKEQQAVDEKSKRLKDALQELQGEIDSLEKKLGAEIKKRDKAYANIIALRRQQDDLNACYYQNCVLLNQAREYSARKDIKAVEDLAYSEVEDFFSAWNESRSFRDNYTCRMSVSLDLRQFGKDGRSRMPGEKPLVEMEVAVQSKTERADSKAGVKQPKGDPIIILKPRGLLPQKVLREAESKTSDSDSSLEDEDDAEIRIVSYKSSSLTNSEIDPEKLKEVKREEEIAKAKKALERKKKLAEKNALKAAIKAQKEAEKKLKEREKKAKKKAATNGHVSDPYADLEEPVEDIEEAMEPEKLDISTVASIPSKAKMVNRASSVRYGHKVKGMESRPKAMIKRKKLSSDLLWIALVVFLGLFLLMIAYLYITTPEMHRHRRYVV